MTCKETDCDEPVQARKLCSKHYQRARKAGLLIPRLKADCSVEGCSKVSHGLGFCTSHYHRFKKYGDPLGGGAPMRKCQIGDTRLETSGYVSERVDDHANARKGWVSQHVLIMSRVLGRPLASGENVHHKNGVKSDNRVSNLELWISTQPSGQRVSDLLEWADEIIAKYGILR